MPQQTDQVEALADIFVDNIDGSIPMLPSSISIDDSFSLLSEMIASCFALILFALRSFFENWKAMIVSGGCDLLGRESTLSVFVHVFSDLIRLQP